MKTGNKPTVCPHCEEPLTPEEVRSLWGQYTSSMVVNHVAGPGRPPATDRCQCGKFTRKRARLRNHICKAPVPTPRRRK